MASSQFNIRETWTTLYTGDTTSGNTINVPNVTNYKFLCLIGYIGTNSGGKRFNVSVSTMQPLYNIDYSVFLTPTQAGQIAMTDNTIILTSTDAHVTAVYGVK